jgi:predicted TIM-barrel fold metal-dependent hydrolase
MTTTSTHELSGLENLVSADSHVIESPQVWEGALPPSFWPDEGRMFQEAPGAMDPASRLGLMVEDGVVAEVLYPSLGLKIFSVEDPELQETCCRLYNQWLIDFCALDPSRLLGIGLIPTYDIDRALEEINFCRQGNLRGIQVWQTPHPDLPFTSDHYDRMWSTAQDAKLPVSLHILTGFNYSAIMHELGAHQSIVESYRGSVNGKLGVVMDMLLDLIMSGVFERFPELRVILVENEIGWLPFALDQWDYYYRRFGRSSRPVPIAHEPSTYFRRQIYATFFRDPMAGRLFDWWGTDNCMWSNDYPHGNTTWPRSREYIAEHLGHYSPDIQQRLTRRNAEGLYGVIASQ